ncbi:MAG: thiamine pyrophosphate-binding protein [Betaproteobacteria bacterium]|nr:thiamine pyrophosphate-binding protein [Betaproteobacteria bacterium]
MKTTVGDVVAAFLEQCGVQAAFGVISIHNMPVLDAFHRRGKIRFVPARSEAGATNMADAYARVTPGLGVTITSTGTAAGNACGAMVEALTGGTPLLHLTGQIEIPYLDRNQAYIHEARDQMAMLAAVSKAAFRVWSAASALATLKLAVQTALTAPAGPVSLEIPIDIQASEIDWPADLSPLPVATSVPAAAALDALANRLAQAKRPLLWLGGGARGASDAVRRLVALGIGVVTSTQGRGILPEDHPMTLGAYTLYPAVEQFYRSCDAMLVVGSRLRGNETLRYKLALPKPLYRIDADPEQAQRNYASDAFVAGDARLALEGLADRLQGRMRCDPAFAGDLAAARDAAAALVRKGIGPYAALVERLQEIAGRDYVWVRDVTVSNSTWGNRLLRIFGAHDGVHALGGGIGQGIQMGIGAAVAEQMRLERASPQAARARKVLCLTGDGGLQVNIGELATAVQENADMIIVLMNDRGYGVIRNIQDAQYGGRRCYVDLHTPDFALLAKSIALPHFRVRDLDALPAALAAALAARGPVMVEIDMIAIGPFASAFAGPPVREKAPA